MPPSRRKHAAAAAGFSLIEVLVALAIVGLVLGATATVFGNGLRGHEVAANVDTALSIAEAKLDAAGVTETLRASRSDGVFANRFQWRVVVTPYDDAEKGAADQPAPAFRLFRIAVTIAWREGRRERQLALATLRMAPAPP